MKPEFSSIKDLLKELDYVSCGLVLEATLKSFDNTGLDIDPLNVNPSEHYEKCQKLTKLVAELVRINCQLIGCEKDVLSLKFDENSDDIFIENSRLVIKPNYVLDLGVSELLMRILSIVRPYQQYILPMIRDEPDDREELELLNTYLFGSIKGPLTKYTNVSYNVLYFCEEQMLTFAFHKQAILSRGILSPVRPAYNPQISLTEQTTAYNLCTLALPPIYKVMGAPVANSMEKLATEVGVTPKMLTCYGILKAGCNDIIYSTSKLTAELLCKQFITEQQKTKLILYSNYNQLKLCNFNNKGDNILHTSTSDVEQLKRIFKKAEELMEDRSLDHIIILDPISVFLTSEDCFRRIKQFLTKAGRKNIQRAYLGWVPTFMNYDIAALNEFSPLHYTKEKLSNAYAQFKHSRSLPSVFTKQTVIYCQAKYIFTLEESLNSTTKKASSKEDGSKVLIVAVENMLGVTRPRQHVIFYNIKTTAGTLWEADLAKTRKEHVLIEICANKKDAAVAPALVNNHLDQAILNRIGSNKYCFRRIIGQMTEMTPFSCEYLEQKCPNCTRQ